MKTFLLLSLLLLGFSLSTAIAQKGKNKSNKNKYHYLSNTKNTDEIKALPTKLERFFYSFTGHFHNTKQADTSSSPFFKHQELIMTPIWGKQRVGEYWFLMAWYRADLIESPLGQFVFKLSKLSRDTFIIERYDFPEDGALGLTWAQEDGFANLRPQDLIKSGCTYHVVPGDKSEFKILLINPLETCVTSTLAAKTKGSYKYAEYDIDVNPEGIVVFNTGYDENGKIVATYKPIGNHFERLPKDQPKYLDILYPKK